MKQTMTTGTGRKANIEGYSIGAKTGTAEKLPRGNGKYVLSFMGFAPADNPEVLVYVVIDEPNVDDQSLGIYVVELAKKIMEDAFPHLNITKTE
jgi:stage V sporulation protein D (sporulation-specific penicillin-binding protein)